MMMNQRYQNTSRISTQTSGFICYTEGNLLIPDISGFTRFVHDTNIDTGKYIISRLLTVLLDCNYLGLEVSEIEGDAILFYKLGKRFTPNEVLAQFDVMQNEFIQELLKLSMETGIELNLGLKLIAHYGPLSEYRVGRFTKLYGIAVIEAHKLLKNSINSAEYVILTDNLLNNGLVSAGTTRFGNKVCETYNQLESICFTWFSFVPELCV